MVRVLIQLPHVLRRGTRRTELERAAAELEIEAERLLTLGGGKPLPAPDYAAAVSQGLVTLAGLAFDTRNSFLQLLRVATPTSIKSRLCCNVHDAHVKLARC